MRHTHYIGSCGDYTSVVESLVVEAQVVVVVAGTACVHRISSCHTKAL